MFSRYIWSYNNCLHKDATVRLLRALHQSGFTLKDSLFLGGRNSAAKEYNISLAVTTNSQKNIFSWLFLLAAKKNMYFLGCLAESPRKWSLSLAVLVGHQEKYVFPWLHCWAAKKIVKNTCLFHISLFDSELKFIIGISFSYELQMWLFFFLKFSKIMIFHLKLSVCMLISVLGSFTYDLFSSIQIDTIKNIFCITISLVTSYFLILW